MKAVATVVWVGVGVMVVCLCIYLSNWRFLCAACVDCLQSMVLPDDLHTVPNSSPHPLFIPFSAYTCGLRAICVVVDATGLNWTGQACSTVVVRVLLGCVRLAGSGDEGAAAGACQSQADEVAAAASELYGVMRLALARGSSDDLAQQARVGGARALMCVWGGEEGGSVRCIIYTLPAHTSQCGVRSERHSSVAL